MIREIATIRIDPARAAPFEAAVREAAPLFRAAAGCEGLALDRVVEEPGTYQLRVKWRTVEDHTVGFRQSPDFERWRALAQPFFLEPPSVIHVEHAEIF